MKKHIKGIKITVIFLICFFVFPSLCFAYLKITSGFIQMSGDPSYSYKITYEYYTQTPAQLNVYDSWDLPNALTTSPVLSSVLKTRTHRGWLSIQKYDCLLNPLFPIQSNIQWGSINTTANDNYFTDAGFNQLVSDFNSYPSVCPSPVLCDQTIIDSANASCPLGLGNSFCEADTLIKQCAINSCADVTPAHYDTICIPVYEGDYRKEHCSDNGGGDIQITADCGNCSDDQVTWGNANCVGGYKYVSSFDCQNTTGICRTPKCGEFSSDCSEKCWGLVDKFTCSESTGTPVITDPCVCKEGSVTPGPPAPVDTVDNNATLSDPTDNDSALLKKIVDNTFSTSQILDTRLHGVETSIQKSSDRSSQDFLSLGQRISDVYNSITGGKTSDGKKHYHLGYQLKDIKEFFTDAYTPPTDGHSEPLKYEDGNFTQPLDTDLQAVLGTQTIPGETSALFTPNITTSLVDPVLRGDILGGTVEIDFSQYETLYQWAGNLLYFLCAIQALFIAFRK